MFGDSFWPRQVGRTATKLSYVTQNSLHCPLNFITSRRHFECYFFKRPHYVPPGIRWQQRGILFAHARDEWNNLSSAPFVIFERAAVGFLTGDLHCEKDLVKRDERF